VIDLLVTIADFIDKEPILALALFGWIILVIMEVWYWVNAYRRRHRKRRFR